jgi:hypothetical protein
MHLLVYQVRIVLVEMIRLGLVEPAEAIVLQNHNAHRAQLVLDALNPRLNARRFQIIQGQRILMHLVQ